MQPSKCRSHFKVCSHFLTALVKKILFRGFYCHFFSVYFLSALQSDNNSLAARAKISLNRGPTRIYARVHKFYCYSKRTLNTSREAAKAVGAMGMVIAN